MKKHVYHSECIHTREVYNAMDLHSLCEYINNNIVNTYRYRCTYTRVLVTFASNKLLDKHARNKRKPGYKKNVVGPELWEMFYLMGKNSLWKELDIIIVFRRGTEKRNTNEILFPIK